MKSNKESNWHDLLSSSSSPAAFVVGTDTLTGHLSYNPESGLRFTCIDALTSMGKSTFLMGKRFDILHGRLKDFPKCTLGGCFATSISPGIGDIGEIEFIVSWLAIGDHINSTSSLNYNLHIVELAGFQEWIIDSPFHLKYPSRNSIETGAAEIVATASMHTIFHCSIYKTKKEYRIRHSCNADESHTSLLLEDRIEIIVQHTGPISIDDISTDIHDIQLLMSVACRKYLPIRHMSMSNNNNNEYTTIHPPVSFLAKFAGSHNQPSYANHFLSFNDIKHDLGSMIAKWSMFPNAFRVQSSLLHAHEERNDQSSDFLFLGVCSALESFHRNLYGGTYLPDSEYDEQVRALRKAIPTTFPNDLKSSIKSSLLYSNEFSLRKRLKCLVEIIGNEIAECIFISTKNGIHQIVETRNSLTHRTSTTSHDVLTGGQLHWATEQSRWLLRCAMLIELGVDRKILCERLKLNSNVKHANAHGTTSKSMATT